MPGYCLNGSPALILIAGQVTLRSSNGIRGQTSKLVERLIGLHRDQVPGKSGETWGQARLHKRVHGIVPNPEAIPERCPRTWPTIGMRGHIPPSTTDDDEHGGVLRPWTFPQAYMPAVIIDNPSI